MAKKSMDGRSTRTQQLTDPAIAAATGVRNSAIPKSAAASSQITEEQIAARAYEIFLSDAGGSQDENWLRAERELRGL